MVIFFQTSVNAAEIELPFVPDVDYDEEIVTSSQAESEASSVENPTDDNKSQTSNHPETDISAAESNQNVSPKSYSSNNNLTANNNSQIPNRPKNYTSNAESERNASTASYSSNNNRIENNSSQTSNSLQIYTSNAESNQNASSNNSDTKENSLSESDSKNETPVFTPNGEEVVSIDNSTLSDTNNYPADTESITTDQSNTPEKVNAKTSAVFPIIIAVLCTAVLIGAVIYTLKKKSKID